MQILLSPSKTGKGKLANSYKQAFKSSRELYIASAFLTNWPTAARLSKDCEKFLFLAGTDFGLTRKEACADVLKWLPKRFKSDFLAVPSSSSGNYHPKVIVWKGRDNRFHSIIGSSNLTQAAFNTNYEANVELEISRREYDRIVHWIEAVAKECQVINDDWLVEYKEHKYSAPKRANSKNYGRVIKLKIPSGEKYNEAIIERRKQQKAFSEIHRKLILAMRKCASGSMSNAQFWEKFKELWNHHPSRIQGSGLQFTGKSANWKQACKSMLIILDSAKAKVGVDLDRIVRVEIDKLAKAGNPVRGAWFSEILSHYQPKRYPIMNGPIEKWLKYVHWKAQRGATEGSAYIELARKLRDAIKQNDGASRDLIELDAVIWRFVDANLSA